MIVRKLAVPLINEKILQQAEHCYIVSSRISDAGFDFIRSRIPPKCRIDMVTGLDEPTSPNVLRRIIKHYQERITLKIYTRNVVHANLYVFDLPFRKSVAYLGSGSFTLEGLKDQEELFWKITQPKEIESLMSWYTSFYEFGIPLTEEIISEYEYHYPHIVRREIVSRKEKEHVLKFTSIDWDAIRFKNQFFKKEDYLVLASVNAASSNPEVRAAREALRKKITALQDETGARLATHKIFPVRDLETSQEESVSSMWFFFSRSMSGFGPGFMKIEVGISSTGVTIRLHLAGGNDAAADRVNLLHRLRDDVYCGRLVSHFSSLGNDYGLEVGGSKRPIEAITKEQMLRDWVGIDYKGDFSIFLERYFHPSDTALSVDNIGITLQKELEKLGTAMDLLGEPKS
jgi:hypothetical protein